MKASYQSVLEREKARRVRLAEQCGELIPESSSIVLEIGCGHGHFLAAYAESHPRDYCVGIDLINKRLEKSNRKREKGRLENLHFLKAEGNEFLDALPPGVQLERIFIIFPDPWPKKRHHKRRLIQTEFLNTLASHTPQGGELYFRTDHQPYYEWTVFMIETHPLWSLETATAWPFERDTFFSEILGPHASLIARRR